jgi:hypothetical protein
VDIFVNDELVTKWEIDWEAFKAFEPLKLRMKAGENRLGFVGHNPAVRIAGDSRLLALALGNLRATGTDGGPACEWQLQ